MGIDADALVARAIAATGMSDLGDVDDVGVGLRVATAALEELDLPEEAREAVVAGWVEHLCTRLRIVDIRHRTPEILEEVIEGPLAVIGLPRTGTTALVDLLAQDPVARSPLQWETAALLPPSSRQTWAHDPRIAAIEAVFEDMAVNVPFVALGLHTFGATLPDECNSFLAMSFWTPNLTAPLPMSRYSEWLRWSTPRRPYGFHRWVLQHLQAHGPGGRWTLKSPFHTFALPQFVEEYPDAMLVQTHRDPVELMASLCGLLSTIRGEGPGDPRRLSTGREMLELWGTGLQRSLAARQDPAMDARVLDISHRQMSADPLGTARSVYERFGLTFTDAAREAMQAWLANPAQHRSSVSFTLQEFGLDPDMVEEGFGPYRAGFGAWF